MLTVQEATTTEIAQHAPSHSLDELRELGFSGRLGGVKVELAVRIFDEDSIEDDYVKMQVAVRSRPKALDKGDRTTQRSGGLSQPGFRSLHVGGLAELRERLARVVPDLVKAVRQHVPKAHLDGNVT